MVWITRLHLWISFEITTYPQVLLQSAQRIGRFCNYLKYHVNSYFMLSGKKSVKLINRRVANF